MVRSFNIVCKQNARPSQRAILFDLPTAQLSEVAAATSGIFY